MCQYVPIRPSDFPSLYQWQNVPISAVRFVQQISMTAGFQTNLYAHMLICTRYTDRTSSFYQSRNVFIRAVSFVQQVSVTIGFHTIYTHTFQYVHIEPVEASGTLSVAERFYKCNKLYSTGSYDNWFSY